MAERELRLFGMPEESVREQLEFISIDSTVTVDLSCRHKDCVMRLSAEDETALDSAIAAVEQAFDMSVYSVDGTSMEQVVVAGLSDKRLTVAVAESCTGGLLAARLTSVAGCSRVFGTGVVSYSWDCKQQLLGVSIDTLEVCGAVSAETACEMADGIRRQSGASIGVAITGEAGPQAAESQPVGTVYVALADRKRVWVSEWHLSGDREEIRAAAVLHAMDMLRRYVDAYPAVMAGGRRLGDVRKSVMPVVTETENKSHRRMAALLPWVGTPRLRIIKTLVLLAMIAVIIGSIWLVYTYFLAPAGNSKIQRNLADMYYNSNAAEEDSAVSDKYPLGMRVQFRSLYDINEDIAGWIHIPNNEDMKYAVMLDANGDYVNHNFYKQYSAYGQPYFDGINETDALRSERLLVIRGNNTHDEQMFSSLLSYRRIAYLQQHSTIEMSTLFSNDTWQITAVAMIDERDGFVYAPASFEDDAAYVKHLEELQKRSMFVADWEPTATDKTLMLVTEAQRDTQLVILARRVDGNTPAPQYHTNGG